MSTKMPRRDEGACDFFRAARIRCGQCGTVKVFSSERMGGGDNEARRNGWQIEWRPRPFVRCFQCLKMEKAP